MIASSARDDAEEAEDGPEEIGRKGANPVFPGPVPLLSPVAAIRTFSDGDVRDAIMRRAAAENVAEARPKKIDWNFLRRRLDR